MRSPEEIANWLLEMIAHVNARAAMYARTRSELDSYLFQLHFTLAYVLDREQDFRRAHQPIHHPDSMARSPDDFHDLINEPAELKDVLHEWQEFDERFGLKLPKLPGYRHDGE